MNTREYFRNWDPMKFILEDEAPDDEYDQEAQVLINWYRHFGSEPTEELVAEKTHEIFVRMLEINPKGFKQDCFSQAGSIKASLIKDVSVGHET